MSRELSLHQTIWPAPRSLHETFPAAEEAQVLLVHGEPASLEPLQLALQQEGFTVNEAGWLAELLDYLREPLDSCSPTNLPDLFVADLDTLGSSGSLEVLSAVCSAGAGARLIVLASAPNAALRRQVEELPSALLLEKPCTDDDRYLALGLLRPC